MLGLSCFLFLEPPKVAVAMERHLQPLKGKSEWIHQLKVCVVPGKVFFFESVPCSTTARFPSKAGMFFVQQVQQKDRQRCRFGRKVRDRWANLRVSVSQTSFFQPELGNQTEVFWVVLVLGGSSFHASSSLGQGAPLAGQAPGLRHGGSGAGFVALPPHGALE